MTGSIHGFDLLCVLPQLLLLALPHSTIVIPTVIFARIRPVVTEAFLVGPLLLEQHVVFRPAYVVFVPRALHVREEFAC